MRVQVYCTVMVTRYCTKHYYILTRLRSCASSVSRSSAGVNDEGDALWPAALSAPSQSSILEMGRLDARFAGLAGAGEAECGEVEGEGEWERAEAAFGWRFFKCRCVAGCQSFTRLTWLCPNWSCAYETLETTVHTYSYE